MRRIAEEQEFRRELPVVLGNVDYQEFRGRLEELDRLLRRSGLENEFVERGLIRQEEEGRREAQEKKRVPPVSVCGRFFVGWGGERGLGLRVLAYPQANLQAWIGVFMRSVEAR